MIAFLFPGQGSQAVGMGKALASAFPEARAAFDEADAALGWPLSALCFDGPDDRLTLTENTQPAILAASVAAWRAVESRGVRAAFAAGHSLGEYSAHVAAGTLSFADALRTVRRRGQYMQQAVPVGEGAMAAVLGLDPEPIAAACTAAAAELAREISERKAAEEWTRRHEAQFLSMIESVKEHAIVLLDHGGRIVSWNKGAELIFGYQTDEILGKHFSCFHPQEEIESGAADEILNTAIASGQWEGEGWRVRKDGSRFWASVVITGVRGGASFGAGLIQSGSGSARRSTLPFGSKGSASSGTTAAGSM